LLRYVRLRKLKKLLFWTQVTAIEASETIITFLFKKNANFFRRKIVENRNNNITYIWWISRIIFSSIFHFLSPTNLKQVLPDRRPGLPRRKRPTRCQRPCRWTRCRRRHRCGCRDRYHRSTPRDDFMNQFRPECTYRQNLMSQV
jgi:hypothetical protein